MKETDAEKLHKAATKGDLKTVERLLAATDWKPDRKALNAALSCAAFWNRAEVMDRLLTAGANPEQTTLAGTLLMGAAMNGNLARVKRLIKAGANIHREVQRETALSAALSENQKHVIKYLENLGATSPPNASLLYASMFGDINRMKRALAEGADLNKKGGVLEETPLMAAARNGHVAAVQFLLKHGADPNGKVDGRPVLFHAVEHGKSLEVLETFLKAGADIRRKYYDETVLMAAASGGSLPIVKRLVELGADIHHRDKNSDRTALDAAKGWKNKEVVAYLRSLGVGSERAPGRALIRAFAKEFGGRPVEHSTGFLLNSNLAGYPCQLSVDTEGCHLSLLRLKFFDAEFRTLKDASLIFSLKKPMCFYPKLRRIGSVDEIQGLNVYRSGRKPVSSGFASRFARKHRQLLEQLKLIGSDGIEIGPGAFGFRWDGTDVDTVWPRVHAFIALAKRICHPPQPERRLLDREWVLKQAPKSAAATASPHSFGGALDQPVACPQCIYGANVMAQIDLSDPALPKSALGRRKLPILWCMSCMPWEPSFYDISDSAPRTLDDKGKPLVRKKLAQGEDDLDVRPVLLTPVPRGKRAGQKSKIGGSPKWIQLEETPDCPKCQSSMMFVMQLASEPCMYGDMGMLYTFACPGCKVMASLVQSH
jgi:ankyrin repeat protein